MINLKTVNRTPEQVRGVYYTLRVLGMDAVTAKKMKRLKGETIKKKLREQFDKEDEE